jgi:hypothetical protein
VHKRQGRGKRKATQSGQAVAPTTAPKPKRLIRKGLPVEARKFWAGYFRQK